MKLQADRIEGVNVVSDLAAESVSINGVKHHSSIVVPWQGTVEAWGATSVEQLTVEDFARLAALAPELVIFGSGPRLRFPPPALMRPLIDKRIGMETMDTRAACRTYNVLVSEGRRVIAALLLG